MRFPVLALFLALLSWPAATADLTGQASIIDGDTIDIHGERIRILDIDAKDPLAFLPDVSPLAETTIAAIGEAWMKNGVGDWLRLP